MHGLGAIVAHQGGWDEVLLVAVPMAVVTWLLWLAKRRVRRAERLSAGGGAGEAGRRGRAGRGPSAGVGEPKP